MDSTNLVDISNTLAASSQSVAGLRQSVQQNSPQAIKAVARQFEGLFVEMMLKSMREATPQDGLMDTDQTRLFTSMQDQQLSQTLASKGIGLADMLVHQMTPASKPVGGRALPKLTDMPVKPTVAPSEAAPVTPALQSTALPNHVTVFKQTMRAHAQAASRATGIPADFMLGQAALESGWGSKEAVAADGTRSHNLFGIKATPNWHGKTVRTTTTEFINGTAQQRVATFRAYDSYADSFTDYAHFLRSNPRYEQVLSTTQNSAQFARGLQQAGYATDPHYADKLNRVIQQSILA